MCMCVCVCLFVSVTLSLSLYIYVCVCMYIYMFISFICIHIHEWANRKRYTYVTSQTFVFHPICVHLNKYTCVYTHINICSSDLNTCICMDWHNSTTLHVFDITHICGQSNMYTHKTNMHVYIHTWIYVHQNWIHACAWLYTIPQRYTYLISHIFVFHPIYIYINNTHVYIHKKICVHRIWIHACAWLHTIRKCGTCFIWKTRLC